MSEHLEWTPTGYPKKKSVALIHQSEKNDCFYRCIFFEIVAQYNVYNPYIAEKVSLNFYRLI